MTRVRAEIHRREYGAIHVTEGPYGQGFVVISLSPGNDASRAAAKAYADLAGILRNASMEVVHERLFGSLSAEPAVTESRRSTLESRGIPSDGPLTYVEGRPPWGDGLAGVLLRTVSGVEGPWRIEDSGQPVGHKWRCGPLTFLVLQNIQDAPGDPLRTVQARRMIERADRLLKKEGATYCNVVRTWFYLSHILEWYGCFNEARNAKYSEIGIMPGPGAGRLLLPASTGIRGETRGRTAGVLDLLALVEPVDRPSIVRQLRNVGQEDAFRYGSAFSRGALVSGPGRSIIEVSGTASIDKSGISRHGGDFRRQVECTLGKIASLLEPEGAGLEDVCSATVFVKRSEDARQFREVIGSRGLKDLPAVCVVADICREELLFEMDGAAVIDRPPSCDTGLGPFREELTGCS